jgi:hypothetical protein
MHFSKSENPIGRKTCKGIGKTSEGISGVLSFRKSPIASDNGQTIQSNADEDGTHPQMGTFSLALLCRRAGRPRSRIVLRRAFARRAEGRFAPVSSMRLGNWPIPGIERRWGMGDATLFPPEPIVCLLIGERPLFSLRFCSKVSFEVLRLGLVRVQCEIFLQCICGLN